MKIKRLLSCGASVLLTGTFVIGGSVLPIVLADYFVQGDDTKTVSADIDSSFLVENNVADDITTTVWYDYSNTATSKATTTTGKSNGYSYATGVSTGSNDYLYANTQTTTAWYAYNGTTVITQYDNGRAATIGVYNGVLQYAQYFDYIVITACNKSYDGEMVIPETINDLPVTGIRKDAFNSSKISSVTIPSSIELIGYSSFQNCKNLKKIIINGAKKIDGYAFYGCSSLKEVILPETLETMGVCTFGACSLLNEIILPESIDLIGSNTFSGCRLLDNINIPANVKSIGERSFYDCSSLNEVVLPASVKSIGKQAFYNCGVDRLVVENPKCRFYSDWNVVGSSCTIYGYPDSTAEKYATDYGYKFADIGEYSPTTVLATTSIVYYTITTTATTTTTSVNTSTTDFGDINKDGKIDASDASDILSYYAYMSTNGTGTLEEYLSK